MESVGPWAHQEWLPASCGCGGGGTASLPPLPCSPHSPGRMPVLSLPGLSGFSLVFVLTLGGVYLPLRRVNKTPNAAG